MALGGAVRNEREDQARVEFRPKRQPIVLCLSSLVSRPWAKNLVQLKTREGVCASQSDGSFSPFASRRNVTA